MMTHGDVTFLAGSHQVAVVLSSFILYFFSHVHGWESGCELPPQVWDLGVASVALVALHASPAGCAHN